MAKSFCIILIFLWAASSSAKLNSLECSPRNLTTKNCHLQWSDIKVHIRGDKVNSFNGVHRSLVDFPIAGEKVEWKKLRLRHLAGKLYLEAEVWGTPAEKTEVSGLNWIVYEYDDVHPEIKVNKKVRRRKPKSREKGQTTYELMDKPLKYKLYIKKKKVYWKSGFDEGEV